MDVFDVAHWPGESYYGRIDWKVRPFDDFPAGILEKYVIEKLKKKKTTHIKSMTFRRICEDDYL